FAGLNSAETSPNTSPNRAQSKSTKGAENISELCEPRATSSQFAQLIRHCAKLPPRGHILRFATARRPSILSSTDLDGNHHTFPLSHTYHASPFLFNKVQKAALLIRSIAGDQDEVAHRRVVVIGPDAEGTNHGFEAASVDIAACLKVIAAPSSFGAAAIARAIVLRYFLGHLYAPLLKMTLPTSASEEFKEVRIPEVDVNVANFDSDRNPVRNCRST
ncbi:unnamed protein product, partial [Anisakis simplex]|uniref:PGM_PMM_I domain-containing protein n=1 Tax=Anisakis simplex TaxID=6269 RepID=A0A0M3J9D3_ANISI